MSNVVKNDAKVIADVSKKIRPGGTIEATKVIKEAHQQAGGEVKKECGRQKKSLENLVKKGGNIESEFKERVKDSKLNYAELTKASGRIKETTAAIKLTLCRKSFGVTIAGNCLGSSTTPNRCTFIRKRGAVIRTIHWDC